MRVLREEEMHNRNFQQLMGDRIAPLYKNRLASLVLRIRLFPGVSKLLLLGEFQLLDTSIYTNLVLNIASVIPSYASYYLRQEFIM
jgi:hypothetical protein